MTKQRGAQYDTTLRYAAAATPATATGDPNQRDGSAMRRGGARTPSPPRSPPTPATTTTAAPACATPPKSLAERRLGRGDLLSVPELAALAHLPADEFIPGLNAPAPAPSPHHRASPPPGRG